MDVFNLICKMEQDFTGHFKTNEELPGGIYVDRFEAKYAERYGQILGLTTSVKYITLDNLTPYHLGFLIQCERVLEKHVIYISRESDLLSTKQYNEIAQYTGLSEMCKDIQPAMREYWGGKEDCTVLCVEPHPINIRAVIDILPNTFTVIVSVTENLFNLSIKAQKMVSMLFVAANRVIFNSTEHRSINNICKQIQVDRFKSEKVLCVDEDSIPFRSYDIYRRLKAYLKTNNNRWIQRVKIVKAVITTNEKYETICFRLFDIKYIDVKDTTDVDIVYMRKTNRSIFFKMYHIT